MTVLFSILLSIAIILGFVLFLGIFMRKRHFVKRDIVIQAPRQKVFDYLKFLKNQDAFNKHAMVDGDRKREFKGTDGTVGYIYSWSGDKSAGVGEKEIKNIIEGKSIETEIRFVKPMKASAIVTMEMDSISDHETKVSWSNAGTLNYPVNLMIPMMEKSVKRGMDESLLNLKTILEK